MTNVLINRNLSNNNNNIVPLLFVEVADESATINFSVRSSKGNNICNVEVEAETLFKALCAFQCKLDNFSGFEKEFALATKEIISELRYM